MYLAIIITTWHRHGQGGTICVWIRMHKWSGKRVDSGQTGDFSNGRSKFMSIYIQVHMRGSVVILKNAIYFAYIIYINDPLIYLSTYRKSKGTHTNTQTYIPYSIFTEKRLREPLLPCTSASHVHVYHEHHAKRDCQK